MVSLRRCTTDPVEAKVTTRVSVVTMAGAQDSIVLPHGTIQRVGPRKSGPGAPSEDTQWRLTGVLAPLGSTVTPSPERHAARGGRRRTPMTSTDLLLDAFERIRDAVHPAVNGLSPDELAFRPDDESNSIAWLVWHLTRIQDDHVAGLADSEQVWTAQGWAERFALPLDPSDTGYGHDPDMVAAVTADAVSLLGYFGRPCEDAGGRALHGGIRPLPGGGPKLGTTRDSGRSPGQRDRRRSPTRGSGGIRPRDPPTTLTAPRPGRDPSRVR